VGRHGKAMIAGVSLGYVQFGLCMKNMAEKSENYNI
jgi:hypothetical protein